MHREACAVARLGKALTGAPIAGQCMLSLHAGTERQRLLQSAKCSHCACHKKGLRRVRLLVLCLKHLPVNPAFCAPVPTATFLAMAEDRGKTALVSIVLVTFSVGVATGWLLNSFARKVRDYLPER
jgi:hypothetical protein